MLYTRYNKTGTKLMVARAQLKDVEKVGFTFEVSPVDKPVVEVVVETVAKVVEVAAEVVAEPVEEKPKRGRKPKVVPAEKDIVL